MEVIHVVLALAALALALITLPGTLELLFLTVSGLMPKRKRESATDPDSIRLAVVIPAHNERDGLPDTLESLLACNKPLDAGDLHVIADNCSDDTADVARRFGVNVLERFNDELRGKGYALDFAFTTLADRGYDAFIVVDADSHVDQNFFEAFRRLFAAGGHSAQCTYKVANADTNLRTRLMNIAFLAFNYLRPLGRDNAGLSAGILGNGFAVSAEALSKVPYNSFSIVEDLEYHPRLIREGYRVEFLSETTVWSDMPDNAADAQSQRERWEGGRFRMILDLAPKLLKDIAKGKWRLVEPLFELMLLPLTYHVLLVIVLLLIASGSLQVYALLAFLVIVAHVFAAMWAGKATKEDWKALFSAPFYMAWKVVNFGGILKAASKGAGWKRTARK